MFRLVNIMTYSKSPADILSERSEAWRKILRPDLPNAPTQTSAEPAPHLRPACPYCDGTGMARGYLCVPCDGWGYAARPHRLHIKLLLSKWSLTLERHRAELDQIEREMIEYAASFETVRELFDEEPTA